MPAHIADIIAVLFFGPLIILIADRAWDQLSHSRVIDALDGRRVKPRLVSDLAHAQATWDSQSGANVVVKRTGDRRAA